MSKKIWLRFKDDSEKNKVFEKKVLKKGLEVTVMIK